MGSSIGVWRTMVRCMGTPMGLPSPPLCSLVDGNAGGGVTGWKGRWSGSQKRVNSRWKEFGETEGQWVYPAKSETYQTETTCLDDITVRVYID